MPGTSDPQHGIQGFAAKIQGLVTRVTNLEVRQRQSSGVVQPGVITQWGGATPPPGALQCNGATFNAALYPALYAVLGTTTLPTIAGTPMYVIWAGPQSSV